MRKYNMSEAISAFHIALQDLSTGKEKVMEVADMLLRYQMTDAGPLVDEWFTHFKKVKNPQKKIALLFVMSDTLMKNCQDTSKLYLREFPRVLDSVVEYLLSEKQKDILIELDKIVSIWQRPKTAIFAEEFTNNLKNKILEATDHIHAEETGADLIQEFPIAQRLAQLESLSESILDQAKREDEIFSGEIVAREKTQTMLLHHKQNAEDLLMLQSQVLMELSQLLEFHMSQNNN